MRLRIGTVVALIAGSAAVSAAQTKNVDRTVPLPPTGSVTLETHNGSIDVRTWDRPEVEIHALIEAAGVLSADTRRFEDTTVVVASTSDSVRITSQYPALTSWSSWFGSNPTIRYTVTAPRTARWTIHDHNARAEVHDLRAALTVETHNGSVHATGLGGPLRVNAHNGSVSADFDSFMGADVTTHNGSVDLVLPSTTAFNLHANTHRARVHSDFPITVHSFGHRQDNVDAAVGSGGPSVRFQSHLGQLNLLSKR